MRTESWNRDKEILEVATSRIHNLQADIESNADRLQTVSKELENAEDDCDSHAQCETVLGWQVELLSPSIQQPVRMIRKCVSFTSIEMVS